MPAPQHFHIGIPLYAWQALDVVGPVDVLHTAQYEGLVRFMTTEEEATRIRAADFTFHYINSNLEAQLTTGNITIKPTTTYSTCPKLDYLLLGGPDPAWAKDSVPEELKAFIVERSKEVKAIWTTCTGALVLAATGLLDGVHATVNHLFVDPAKAWFPAVKWDKTTNWVVGEGKDGLKIWTASGAVAGMDMIAQWYREATSPEVVNYSTSLLEYEPRDIDAKPMKYMNGRKEMVDGVSKL